MFIHALALTGLLTVSGGGDTPTTPIDSDQMAMIVATADPTVRTSNLEWRHYGPHDHDVDPPYVRDSEEE